MKYSERVKAPFSSFKRLKKRGKALFLNSEILGKGEKLLFQV